MAVESIGPTSLNISWTLADSWTADNYTISYSHTATTCFNISYDDITGIDGNVTTFTLTGLEESTEYTVTITATLSDGTTRRQTITLATLSAGLYSHASYLVLQTFTHIILSTTNMYMHTPYM